MGGRDERVGRADMGDKDDEGTVGGMDDIGRIRSSQLKGNEGDSGILKGMARDTKGLKAVTNGS